MPLGQLARFCPLLLEDDFLQLSEAFTLQKDTLVDSLLGVSHTLHGEGRQLVRQLSAGVQYQQLCALAELHKIQRQEVHSLLGFLNKVGGLKRQRAPRDTINALRIQIQHAIVGVIYSPLCWRVAPSLSSYIWTTLRATTPVILAIGVVATLWWAAGFASGLHIAAMSGGGLLVFIASIVLHEIAHSKVLAYRGYPTDILQIGMRLGVIHVRTRPSVEIASALAGPLAGCGASLAAAAALNAQPVLSICCYAIAALHLVGLLPCYGDGTSLVQALRERRSTREKRSVSRTN